MAIRKATKRSMLSIKSWHSGSDSASIKCTVKRTERWNRYLGKGKGNVID